MSYVSPYLVEATKRANAIPKAFIDHDRRQYTFSRGITDGIPLEKSDAPIESWFSGITACICMVALVIMLWIVAANVAQEFVK